MHGANMKTALDCVYSLWYNAPKKLPSAPEDGRNFRPKHVELIEFTNKLLLLELVGCLY